MAEFQVKKVALQDCNGDFIVPIIDPSDIGNYTNINAKDLNYTLVGTPTISDYVVSNFIANANYIQIPMEITLGSSFELLSKFRAGDVMNRQIVMSTLTKKYFNIGIVNNHVYFSIGNDTGSNYTKNGITTLAINTDYYVKLTYNGNDYKLYTSTDKSNWVLECTLSITSKLPICNIVLGVGDNLLLPLNGSIDLRECYIKVKNKIVWEMISGISNPLENVNVYTNTAWEAEESVSDIELNLVPFTMVEIDYSSGTPITANAVNTFDKSGRYVTTDTSTTLPTISMIYGTDTVNVRATWYDISANTKFKANMAGKFYFFRGQ